MNIILGPPGTGKTTTLLNIIDDKINQGVLPEEICFVSFTKKAANEAIDRSCRKFNLSKDDLPLFRTLHSLAFQLVGADSKSMLGSGDYFKIANMLGIFISCHNDNDFLEGRSQGHSKGDRLLFTYNLARARGVELEKLHAEQITEDLKWAELERLQKTIDTYKSVNYKYDFTDLLHKATEQGYFPDIKVLIVDEAQDLSRAQWKFIEMIMFHHEDIDVYIAGDDDQSIYQWAGADVDYFINLVGNENILGRSYRVPQKIGKLANNIISSVSKRKEKDWAPREEPGSVNRVTTVESINMAKGEWLILGRNKFILEDCFEQLKSQGYFFEYGDRSPVNSDLLSAIRAWEFLRGGKKVEAKYVKRIYEYFKIRKDVEYGSKSKVKSLEDHIHVDIDLLRRDFGLITMDIWHKAFTRLQIDQREYILESLRKGEKITKEARIKLSTIHSTKGGEADNVVLFTDMAKRTFKEMHENPDDEHRVWYVAVTRAKQNLYVIQPKTPNHYKI